MAGTDDERPGQDKGTAGETAAEGMAAEGEAASDQAAADRTIEISVAQVSAAGDRTVPIRVPVDDRTVELRAAAVGAERERADAYDEEPGGEYEPDTATRPAGKAPRLSAAAAMIGLLLGLLGFALVVQLRSNATDPELATARPEDLVRILSDLDGRQDRLRQEIASLEASQRKLASGVQGQAAALEEARRRADELGILAGTLPAQGSGLQVKFVAGSEAIAASTVLDAVEELRGAGAEAMQIAGEGGSPVRIVASTYFADSKGGLVVDGVRLTGPYTLSVIGDPQTMHTALNIPGGVVDMVHQRGGNVIVQESDTVGVTALHEVVAPKFARPVS
ncbi:DUF881 domain-containing protein [Planosporangium flavigriseum]|uniref:DUF881 domain-containing protein n=1 Tax=Planosporangium flavigriseum TaxID=373681 RepID=A0A8J3LPI5_9ACTN|nr:DUF881 domain-containing protein [Planosporangium flavigriseum]GIG71649.1 hypothetical protein Pfl04_00530 [Planosporangium flavigriseum]